MAFLRRDGFFAFVDFLVKVGAHEGLDELLGLQEAVLQHGVKMRLVALRARLDGGLFHHRLVIDDGEGGGRMHILVVQRGESLCQQREDVAARLVRRVLQAGHGEAVQLLAHGVDGLVLVIGLAHEDIGILFGVFQQKIGGGHVIVLGGLFDDGFHFGARVKAVLFRGADEIFLGRLVGAVEQIPDAPVAAFLDRAFQGGRYHVGGGVFHFLGPALVVLRGRGNVDLVLQPFGVDIGRGLDIRRHAVVLAEAFEEFIKHGHVLAPVAKSCGTAGL